MELKKLSEFTDLELLQEAKKMKTASITNAVIVGFLIGIIIYSIMKNGLGFLLVILLFLIYKFVDKSKYNNKELEKLLKERNLK